MWQHTKTDGSVEDIGSPRSVVHDDVQHSADIFTKWSAEELAAIGIVPIAAPALQSVVVMQPPPEVHSSGAWPALELPMVQAAPMPDVARADVDALIARLDSLQNEVAAAKAAPAPVVDAATDTAARAEVAALVARLDGLQEELAAAKAADTPVAAATQAPTIIETREEVDPSKLRSMILLMQEEQHEAVAYYDGADPSQFPLLAKRAASAGISLAIVAQSVIAELAAVKSAS